MKSKGRILGHRKPIHKLINKMDGLKAIYSNGANNLYPYYVENSVSGSPIASRAHNMHALYIAGSIEGEDVVVNKFNDIKLSNLALSCAKDLSKFDGFFIHVSYKLDGQGGFEKHDFKKLKYMDCRISKEDDADVWSFVFEDDFFDRDKKLFKKTNENYYYRYNDKKENILAQIKKDCEEKGLPTEGDDWLIEGVRNYRGQVIFVNYTGEFPYPESPIDSVLNDCNVDYYNSKYNIEQSASGFVGKTVFFVKNNEGDESDYLDLYSFIGTDESGGAYIQPLGVGETPDDVLQVKTFTGQFDDKIQKATHQRNKENIYGAFDNIPWLLVESGSGALFSPQPESYELASTLYSKRTRKKREFLQNKLSELIGVEFKLLEYDQ